MKSFIASVILLYLIFSHFEIGANEVILQTGLNSYDGCDDTYIWSQRPDENYGSEDKLGSKYEYCAA